MRTTSVPDFLPVLLGSDMNVYGMARSFHEAYGATSAAIGKGRLNATAHSRIVTVEVAEPNLEDDQVFCRTLLRFAEQHPGRELLLVSCGDNYSKLLARNQDALRGAYRFRCIGEPLLLRLSMKESFYQVCQEHGFAFPQTTTCSPETYRDVKLPFGFPVIIKPSNSVAYWNCSFPHKKKVFVAQNRQEFDAILAAIYGSSYQDHLILQEYIPGDDSAMRVMNCYCGGDGKVKLMALGRTLLEEHSPEGIGSYAAIISSRDEAVSQQIRAFLEGVGYVGFANFDMKLDPRDGRYKLFEMNLRQGRSSYYVTAAGYNMARWLVDDVLLEKDLPLTIAENQVLWSIIPKDVIFHYVQDEELKRQARQLIREGKYCQSMRYGADTFRKRFVQFHLSQMNYRKKYKQCFGNKSLRD